jgi:RNA polymerase sigma-70 factor (ECF subfamily)
METRVQDSRQQLDPSDEALVERVRRQDVIAFGQLYDRYARPIYILAVTALDRAEAEEIVQEVFLRLWHKAHQFRPDRGPFGAWFMTIARHHVWDVSRRLHREPSLAAEIIDQLLIESANSISSDVEEEAWSQEVGEAILHALQGLPAEQRRALVLAYFGGLSQSSIAEHFGWPLGTVKKRIRLGLQKLRTALAARYGFLMISGEPEEIETTNVRVNTAHKDAE